jgi:hypothetical protein
MQRKQSTLPFRALPKTFRYRNVPTFRRELLPSSSGLKKNQESIQHAYTASKPEEGFIEAWKTLKGKGRKAEEMKSKKQTNIS